MPKSRMPPEYKSCSHFPVVHAIHCSWYPRQWHGRKPKKACCARESQGGSVGEPDGRPPRRTEMVSTLELGTVLLSTILCMTLPSFACRISVVYSALRQVSCCPIVFPWKTFSRMGASVRFWSPGISDSDLSSKMWTHVQRISLVELMAGLRLGTILKFDSEIVTVPSFPLISSPIGREPLQLARARWRVPGVNRDLLFAIVALFLCPQPQPTSIPPTDVVEKLPRRQSATSSNVNGTPCAFGANHEVAVCL